MSARSCSTSAPGAKLVSSTGSSAVFSNCTRRGLDARKRATSSSSFLIFNNNNNNNNNNNSNNNNNISNCFKILMCQPSWGPDVSAIVGTFGKTAPYLSRCFIRSMATRSASLLAAAIASFTEMADTILTTATNSP